MKNWLKYTWNTFKVWALFKLWAIIDKDLIKQYQEREWQKRAMKLRVDYFTRQQAHINKQDNPDRYFDKGSWFVGVIPDNWVELIDAKIEELHRLNL